MNTPICDFLDKYAKNNTLRLHMPGHKGENFLGFEAFDITEINGADSLFEANGIIKESEENASKIFGCPTFYSTEGSSLCIRAMLLLAKQSGVKKILAGRNAHKVFITACALLDIEVEWFYGDSSYLSCKGNIEALKETVKNSSATAVYITSPDYLGYVCNISEIAKICKENSMLLMVDNAHGAYLKFLTPSFHPIDLGADLCCDSAHKTLPCLTGGAYLHIKDESLALKAKNAMSVFASTSPSYLILASLDNLNKILNNGYKNKLNAFVLKAEQFKTRLENIGYTLFGNEPLKITLCTKLYGYKGTDFANILRRKNIECEFADSDFLVMILSISTDLETLYEVLSDIKPLPPIDEHPPKQGKAIQRLSLKDAILCDFDEIDVEKSKGEILANTNLSCPPAVPIAICGEEITKDTIEAFKYYGIKKCHVVK